ncbi:MAG: extracellular solute-binding protein, partial [Clostridia bacterium]
LNDKSVIAGVAGNWIYDSITNKDVKLAILPKIKLGNETVDMKSFLGCKLMGVNSTTKYQEASHALANYLTSEAVQTERITKLKTGPSNIKAAESQAAKALPTAQIIAQQAANSVPQINLPAGFWDAVKTTCDAVNAKLHAGDKTYFTEEGTPVTAKLDELLVAMKTAFKLKV